MNRRDFLHGSNLIQPAGQILGALEEIQALAAPPETKNEDIVLLRFARQAMATTFEVILPFGSPDLQACADAALDLVDQLEAEWTVYRADSAISQVNQQAGRQSVLVSPRIFELLVYCQRLWQETGGAFDIAIGALIKAWGFFRRAGRVPSQEELSAVRNQIGMRHMRLDSEKQTVRFLRPGLEINLGSIGKGYALDVVVSHLRDNRNVRSALLHGGHSSVYALGSEPGSERSWSIGLLDPEEGRGRLAVMHLKDRGMGTSAATYQHLEHQGRKLPHLLDPRTGWPAEGMLMATVTAPSAALADALATAFFVLGVDRAKAYCASHPEIGAILIPNKTERPLLVLGQALREAELIVSKHYTARGRS
jgi:FAD:protein FMN transferase